MLHSSPPNTRAEAEALDREDPLAESRAAFTLPEGVTYLVGHSLGPATQSARARVAKALEQEWADGLVGSWNTAGWIDLATMVGGRLARLVGVEPSEIIVCDSVSVNLFKLAAAALSLARTPRLIVEDDEFPTDQYIAGGLAGLAGVELVKAPPDGGLDALSGGGVAIKSLVNYRSAEITDMAAWEAEAESCGGLIVWDLSHATGVLDLRLAHEGAKLAAGCTYKYLNGGPGAPAFVYVRTDLAGRMTSPLPGWLGHARPFAFESDYHPATGVARFTAGTPPILSLAALDGALGVFDGVDLEALQAKARQLGDLCLARANKMGLAHASPPIGASRGGHVSVEHAEGYAIVRALAERGRQTDFRTPNTIRFGLSPLFLSYTEIWDTMDDLELILARRLWDEDRFKLRAKVT